MFPSPMLQKKTMILHGYCPSRNPTPALRGLLIAASETVRLGPWGRDLCGLWSKVFLDTLRARQAATASVRCLRRLESGRALHWTARVVGGGLGGDIS